MKAPNWICRNQTHDFGIDLEAELTAPAENGEELSGAIIKLQVKGTLKPIFRGGYFYIRLRTDFLRYATQFQVPVLLLVVNLKSGNIHYLWLQEYLNERNDIFQEAQSVLLKVPYTNVLEKSFEDELPKIALGVARGAQVMAVQRLFEVFSSKYDRKAIELSSELLMHLSEGGYLSIFNAAIEKLIQRGPHLSRVDSQAFGKVLSDIARRFGNRLTAEQICRMIVRGDSYSLAGLDGLSGLYDAFPDHALRLDLPRLFDEMALHELSWYCQFRQANPRLDSLKVWNRIMTLDTCFETATGPLHIPDEFREYCYRKWPNRADAVYLQFLRAPAS